MEYFSKGLPIIIKLMDREDDDMKLLQEVLTINLNNCEAKNELALIINQTLDKGLSLGGLVVVVLELDYDIF